MKFTQLRTREDVAADATLKRLLTQFQTLLELLEQRALPANIITHVNSEVEKVNAVSLEAGTLKKTLRKSQNTILKLLGKELKLVPRSHYSKLWMVVGMSAFGLPSGILLGSAIGNMGMIGAGLPFGMGIGALLGAGMDKKAAKEGRQLDVEIKP